MTQTFYWPGRSPHFFSKHIFALCNTTGISRPVYSAQTVPRKVHKLQARHKRDRWWVIPAVSTQTDVQLQRRALRQQLPSRRSRDFQTNGWLEKQMYSAVEQTSRAAIATISLNCDPCSCLKSRFLKGFGDIMVGAKDMHSSGNGVDLYFLCSSRVKSYHWRFSQTGGSQYV